MALLLLGLGLAALAGCGEAAGAPQAGAQAVAKEAATSVGSGAPAVSTKAVALDQGPARVEVIEDGVARPLKNGGRIALRDGGAAEIFVAPYPPSPESELHVYLSQGPAGEAVSDAAVALRQEMQFMDHGVVIVPARQREPGHYMGPLSLGMYGEWLVDVDIRRPNSTGWVELLLRVFP